MVYDDILINPAMKTSQPKWKIQIDGFNLEVTAEKEADAYEIGRIWVDVKQNKLPKK